MTIGKHPKPTTDKQLAANQRNAQKSTGPRTGDGKARSSMNATTHGIYAHPTAIPGGEFAENSDDVAEFTRQVVEDLRPTSELERLLATRVAATLLHAARLDRYAALQIARSSRLGIIEQVAQASLGHGEFHAEIAAEKIVTTSLERIYQLDARVGRELERSLATYTRARKILVADQQ